MRGTTSQFLDGTHSSNEHSSWCYWCPDFVFGDFLCIIVVCWLFNSFIQQASFMSHICTFNYVAKKAIVLSYHSKGMIIIIYFHLHMLTCVGTPRYSYWYRRLYCITTHIESCLILFCITVSIITKKFLTPLAAKTASYNDTVISFCTWPIVKLARFMYNNNIHNTISVHDSK